MNYEEFEKKGSMYNEKNEKMIYYILGCDYILEIDKCILIERGVSLPGLKITAKKDNIIIKYEDVNIERILIYIINKIDNEENHNGN